MWQFFKRAFIEQNLLSNCSVLDIILVWGQIVQAFNFDRLYFISIFNKKPYKFR